MKSINDYPNINFIFREQGVELALNAEIQSAVNRMILKMKEMSSEFDKIVNTLEDFNFSLQYKYQYLPQDNFIIDFVPGYPKKTTIVRTENIIDTMDQFREQWEEFKETLLFKMKSGILKHPSGRFFNEKEQLHAEKRNPNPNFIIQIMNNYPSNQIDALKKGVVTFFRNEIFKIKKLAEFVNM